ncbi:hypothetical protein PAXRUDRAFT_829024 [Paxillus rubicundulus Ve08.2h10]|uniref:Uncharacterized protein n=1 Tax=Paxillus rubicundulus Ve08.2h10 TaxID=930991 RepID=A0A0D0E6P3_9AGAM|nr:hypothetical protein PAXRUDRAFT_829024 [Paxillus rubicundulus Ve08.2h10]
MGISGLLPLLKSIQVNKHLSDFAGQTLAVDAYVWLHRGVYACATELATGKKTTKYVDYAMHRVRLLRHHKIQPYVVLDGGPLPAKKGTESERKQRRAENLAKANALAAQGKHNQAREFYVKCVDVTPQMAYQFIKALRTEGVQYVVAPYEADAQMAYLERIGLVDGIITEDSDLLVFGCRKVLFKLDSVACTITSISRDDFGSVTAAEGGISLLGWTDSQFRAMAILSGCDYLPSIPGVGLKTAWSLLRKHRTVEQLVRALRLEGKKPVPKGYFEAYCLAEKVFLHQRVYCPLEECLVSLTEVPTQDVMDAETEAYIGSNLDSLLAKKLACGDLDPITLLPMIDTNPGFVTRVPKALPLRFNHVNRPSTDKGKGKAKEEHGSVNLLGFFSPKPRSALSRSNSAPTKKTITTGKNSGKRTLVDVLDDDFVAKRMKIAVKRSILDAGEQSVANIPSAVKERRVCSSSSVPDMLAGPSRLPSQTHQNRFPAHHKENIDPCNHLEDHLDEPLDHVSQEDGYMSPASSYCRSATPDLSSPARNPMRQMYEGIDDFGADIISSPTATRRDPPGNRKRRRSTDGASLIGEVFVRGTPSPINAEISGPDLKDMLSICSGDDIDEVKRHDSSEELTPTGSGPLTPDDMGHIEHAPAIDMTISDELNPETCGRETRMHVVANGWWNKWAISKDPRSTHKLPMLRRLETTVTPDGRQSGRRSQPGSAPPKGKVPHATPSTRKTLAFFEQHLKSDERHAGPGRLSNVDQIRLQDSEFSARDRLAHFRSGS